MADRPSELITQLYDQLRKAAQLALNSERAGHTLTATALVHEAYLRLGKGELSGPAEFYVAATNAMRRILIDHARARTTLKRGGRRDIGGSSGDPGGGGAGGRRRGGRGGKLSLSDFDQALQLAAKDRCEEILILDDALSRLEKQDPQGAQVVRLRFFAGLEIRETAAALGVSEATVKRDWQAARAVLYRLLKDAESPDPHPERQDPP